MCYRFVTYPPAGIPPLPGKNKTPLLGKGGRWAGFNIWIYDLPYSQSIFRKMTKNTAMMTICARMTAGYTHQMRSSGMW
jgi:hypothetical protein